MNRLLKVLKRRAVRPPAAAPLPARSAAGPVLLLSGVAVAVLLTADFVLPLGVSLAAFGATVVWGLARVRTSEWSLLPKVAIVFFALPFVHVVSFLSPEHPHGLDFLWGLKVNAYQFDPDIIARTMQAGLIGICGLVGGAALMVPRERTAPAPIPAEKTLGLPAFSILALLAVFFSWISAPLETIFEAAYTTSIPFLGNLNFNGGWLISFVLVLFLAVDLMAEPKKGDRVTKTAIVACVIGVIVLGIQFIRGDRESVALLIATACLWLADRPRRGKESRVRLVQVGLVLAAVFVVAQIVGLVRSESTDGGFGQAISDYGSNPDALLTGTWSAVLMSPVSAVGDLRDGALTLKYGRTYLDYLLSLPPGPLTQALGVTRPLEATHGPAWELTYGYGGLHALVVPLLNFGPLGVFGMLGLYGLCLGNLDARVDRDRSGRTRLFYATLILVIPFWFWYGEMNLIRALLTAWAVAWARRLVLSASARASLLGRRFVPNRPPSPLPRAAVPPAR